MTNEDLSKLQVVASIDTLSIRTPDNDLLLPDAAEDTGHSKDGITSIKINPNKFAGYEVYSFSDYRQQMRQILDGSGINQFWYSRVDFRFDSYQPEGRYQELEKNKPCLDSFLLLPAPRHQREPVRNTPRMEPQAAVYLLQSQHCAN